MSLETHHAVYLLTKVASNSLWENADIDTATSLWYNNRYLVPAADVDTFLYQEVYKRLHVHVESCVEHRRVAFPLVIKKML